MFCIVHCTTLYATFFYCVLYCALYIIAYRIYVFLHAYILNVYKAEKSKCIICSNYNSSKMDVNISEVLNANTSDSTCIRCLKKK